MQRRKQKQTSTSSSCSPSHGPSSLPRGEGGSSGSVPYILQRMQDLSHTVCVITNIHERVALVTLCRVVVSSTGAAAGPLDPLRCCSLPQLVSVSESIPPLHCDAGAQGAGAGCPVVLHMPVVFVAMSHAVGRAIFSISLHLQLVTNFVTLHHMPVASYFIWLAKSKQASKYTWKQNNDAATRLARELWLTTGSSVLNQCKCINWIQYIPGKPTNALRSPD